jgi:uncharacterized membrane protein (UPF0127 family)
VTGPDRSAAPRLEPSGAARTRTVTVRNLTRATTVASAVHVPLSSAERRRGLLKHDRLEADDGLWIVPCEAIHTFGMRFAIDILFLNSKRTVLKVSPAVPRGRIRVCLRAESVLELAPGAIERSGTCCGDVLQFEPVARP